LGSGVPDRAAYASPAPVPELPISSPTVGGDHRRAGMEPRASARGTEGPSTPPSPEGAEDGSVESAPPESRKRRPEDSPGARAPGYGGAPTEAVGESPRGAGVPEAVTRPLDRPRSSSHPPRRTDSDRDPEALPPVETFRGSRRRRAAAGGDGGPSAGSEREIPLVEAVSRPTAPPRPLLAVRGAEPGAAGPGTRQWPSPQPEGPRVHIGKVDVVVQAPPEPRTASKPEPRSTGLTSRLYLRRL
jgi:hypothetical protein